MKVIIALMALVVVASALTDDEEMQAEVEFIKRDPVLQDYFMAEKRGQSMRKYKGETLFLNRTNKTRYRRLRSDLITTSYRNNTDNRQITLQQQTDLIYSQRTDLIPTTY